ncbi:hypothetical protein L1987_23842 [Smallanthus sonchifolius]|uniref:Uncharacterized protein n=1 Tax=Smallanthus sonchifolius TaxID=185202 RepID=A0ACB9IKI4_9ASTR|nr:hypothetical protein L1987_23842 [Smallanthus sonchifolius]
MGTLVSFGRPLWKCLTNNRRFSSFSLSPPCTGGLRLMATNSGGVDTHLKTQNPPSKSTPEPTAGPKNQKLQPHDSSPNPNTPPIPANDSKLPPTPATDNSRPRQSNSVPDSDVIHVPSYSSKPTTRFSSEIRVCCVN